MKFETFLSEIEARNPVEVNRNCDACTWYWKDIDICHERTYWGFPRLTTRESLDESLKNHQLLRMATSNLRSSYWGNVVFTDIKLAKSEAKKYDAHVEMCFYCDEENPTWFLIFNDLDKAAKHAFDNIKF